MLQVYVCLFLAIFTVSHDDPILTGKKAVIWPQRPYWTYLREKFIYVTVAENFLYWLREAAHVIMCYFQNMSVKANSPPANIVVCYISLPLKTRGWWKTLCHLPTVWSNSCFLSIISCLSLSCRRRSWQRVYILKGLSEVSSQPEKRELPRLKELKMVKCNIHGSKVNIFNSWISLHIHRKAPLSASPSHILSCVESSGSSLIIFDTFYETVFWE